MNGYPERAIALSKGVICLLCFIAISALSLAAAFRIFGLDRDYSQYLLFYSDLEVGYAGRFEYGFVLLTLFVKQVFQRFEILLFLVAFISLTIKFYVISQYRFLGFWILIYVLILFPVHEMTQLRVSLGISFGYLATHYARLSHRRFLSSILFLIGISFHWTILILAPFVIFKGGFSRFSLRHVAIVLFFPSMLIYMAMGMLEYLNPQVERMLATAGQMEANVLSSRNIIFSSILLIGLSSGRALPAYAMPWFYVSLMGLGLWYGMLTVPIFSHRLLEITIFSYFLWIPFLPTWRRRISMFLFFVLATYMFIAALWLDPLFAR